MHWHRIAPAVALAAAVLAPSAASAATLTVQGARLAIDGRPKFLTFISYFGAMGAANAPADLAYLAKAGFDGVRVWPNSPEAPKLMRADGTLDAGVLDRLLALLRTAAAYGLVVDVTFTAEHVTGISATAFRSGVAAAVAAMRPNGNVLVDLQNEHDVYGPGGRSTTPADTAALVTAARAADPARVIFASFTANTTPETVAAAASARGFDLVAYHDPRTATWFTPATAIPLVAALGSTARPVYLQEPNRYPFAGATTADAFHQARLSAKLAGAAAWCFHTDLGFNLASSLFQTRLESRAPEREVVAALTPRVTFTSGSGAMWSATGAGITAMPVTPDAATVFRIVSDTGGPLVSGDRVMLAVDGGPFVTAAAGQMLAADAPAMSDGALFVVTNVTGGAISSGDGVALQLAVPPPLVRVPPARSRLWFVSVFGGRGTLSATGAARGLWETFTLRRVN